MPPGSRPGPSGAHLGAIGISPVKLGVDQRTDVDAIDRHVLDLAMDVDIDQLDAAHHRPFQVDGAELRVTQVDSAKLRTAEVDTLEPGATEIGTIEVSHPMTVTSSADEPVSCVRAMGGPEGPTEVAAPAGRGVLRRGGRR